MSHTEVESLISTRASEAKCKGLMQVNVDLQELNPHKDYARPGKPPALPHGIVEHFRSNGFTVTTHTDCFGHSTNCDYGCTCPLSIPTNIVINWSDPPRGSYAKDWCYQTMAYSLERKIATVQNQLKLVADGLQTLRKFRNEPST